jgi:outer membrane protein assembly factor BamB
MEAGAFSYPLIIGAAVFVVGVAKNSNFLYSLSTVDGSTLWGPIRLGSSDYGTAANAAWDAGKLFTVDGHGIVSAFDAGSGRPVWTRSILPWSREGSTGPFLVGPPIAVEGIVFVAAGATLTALREDTGEWLWSNGDAGSPTSAAYVSGMVVLEYIGGGLTAMRPDTGRVLWHTVGNGVGGGGDVPVIYRDRIYARDFWQDPNGIFELNTGRLLSTFQADTVPSFENGLGFFVVGGELEARNLDGTIKWSLSNPTGYVATPPLAANGIVYVAANGSPGEESKVLAIDETTGSQVWSDQLDSEVAPANESQGMTPTTGLGASDTTLVVPTKSAIYCYGQ